MLTRTVVGEDFRAPIADQFSLEIQRQLAQNLAFKVGYVGTFGKRSVPDARRQPASAVLRQPVHDGPARRSDASASSACAPTTAESWYHSLQTGLDKRLSHGLSAGVHYTWSKYPRHGVGGLQSVERRGGRRAGLVRHRQRQGPVLVRSPAPASPATSSGSCRGCAISGASSGRCSAAGRSARSSPSRAARPFTALNGADPTGALAGIDGLVGNAIRPNINTDLDLSKHDRRRRFSPPAARVSSVRCAACRAPRAPASASATSGATRCAPTASATSTSGSRRTRGSPNGHNIQLRIELFNATNTRNFGIPEGRINSTNFLNQWGTDGGNRRIWVALRYVF